MPPSGQRPCHLMLRTFFKRLFMSKPDLLAVGDPAPDFACATHTGETVHLADFQGRRLVLWFFPKADTPG